MRKFYIIEQNATGVGGHYYNYTRVIAKAARAQGFDVIVLANQRFEQDFGIEGVRAVKTFHYTWLQAEWQPPKRWAPGMFSFDLCNALYETGAEPGDIIFAHTVGNQELKTLLRLMNEMSPDLGGLVFHILLRYDPDGMRASFPEFRTLFKQLSASRTARNQVVFHSDTDRLARQYSAITHMDFHVAPIPFEQEPLLAMMAEQPAARASDAPLTIAYVGDARREKNYHYLPDAVEKALADPEIGPKVRFALQSNFNTENGEEGIKAARERLERLGEEQVELLYNQMTSEQYYGLIHRADAVIVPYNAQQYVSRSSGILVEAMAAGKPVLVTKGSWMESQVDASHAVVIEGPEHIYEGVRDLLLNFDTLKHGAELKQPAVLAYSSAEAFMRHLLAHTPAPVGVFGAGRQHILAVLEGGDLGTPNGMRRIMEMQLAYLTNAGYDVTVLFLASQFGSFENRQQIIQTLNAVAAPYGVAKVLFAFQDSQSSDLAATALGKFWQGVKHSIKYDMSQSARFDFSAETLGHLVRHRPDGVLLNYITRFPVLESLGLDDVPVVCEIHDIQSKQRAIYGKRAFGSRDWDLEKSYLARCKALISLNAEETAFVKADLPDLPVHTTGYFPPYVGQSWRDLLCVGSVAELVASCGPADPGLGWGALAETSVRGRLEAPSKIDLLFISSDHQPNRDGLRTFLTDIYIPHLKPRGVNLFIVGTVNHAVAMEGLSPLDQVYAIGAVEDLAPLYSAARTVILPIWEGAGRAVKTFEALAHGVPVVASPMAIRGEEEALSDLCIGHSAEEFARHITALMDSAELRQRYAERSVEKYRACCAPTLYTDRMRAVFPPLQEMTDAPLPSGIQHVEVDSTLFRANRTIMAWIRGFNMDDLSFALEGEKVSALLAEYRKLLSGEISVYDVPMLASYPPFALTILNCQNRPWLLDKFDAFARTLTGASD